MSMTLDISDFERGMKKLIEQSVPKEVDKGLFKAGAQLLDDARDYEPHAPRDESMLWGSGVVQKPESSTREVGVAAGFNIEYAARWHELTPAEDAKINWTLPGSGRKYLEKKMARFKNDYMKIVADHLKRLLGGA